MKLWIFFFHVHLSSLLCLSIFSREEQIWSRASFLSKVRLFRGNPWNTATWWNHNILKLQCQGFPLENLIEHFCHIRKIEQFSKNSRSGIPLFYCLALKCVSLKKILYSYAILSRSIQGERPLVRTLSVGEIFYLLTLVYIQHQINYYLVLAFQNVLKSFFLVNKWKNIPLPIVHNVFCVYQELVKLRNDWAQTNNHFVHF